jgi:hypothetical protein
MRPVSFRVVEALRRPAMLNLEVRRRRITVDSARPRRARMGCTAGGMVQMKPSALPRQLAVALLAEQA